MIKYTLALLLLIVLNDIACAATYYVDTDASDDNGSGSEISPKKYISSGIGLMSGGDTLIIENGVYTGFNNMIGTIGGHVFPPSGIDREHPTVIRARNVGGTIIDAEYTDVPFSNAWQALPAASFIHVDGIHFRHGGENNIGGVFSIKGSYHKVTRCGFEDGASPSQTAQKPIAYIAGGSDHVLFEDCWAWGKGRYGIYFQSSGGGVTNSIMRRCVVRQDDSGQGPTAGIMFYNSRGNAVQNCIVLDSRVPHTTSDTYGGFSMTANDGLGIGGNIIDGSIALNNINYAGFVSQASIVTDVVSVKNSVFWNNGSEYYTDNGNPHGLAITPTDSGTFNFNHIVSGANRGTGFRSNTGYLGVVNVTNSISVNNGMYGYAYMSTVDHVDTYGNTSGATLATTITNGVATDPLVASLLHLPRIVSSTSLDGAASDGGDIGATIMYQIGGSGTFYGDAGWDAVSATQLWPFQNESIWATKIASYTATGPGGNRGFAAVNSSTPLTAYIWEYLGNLIPADIYGATPTPIDGACGSADGGSFGIPPTTGLCSAGTAGTVSANGSFWTWPCDGIDGGDTDLCSASTLVDGTLPWIKSSSAGNAPVLVHPTSGLPLGVQ